jgi:hypothetical protein
VRYWTRNIILWWTYLHSNLKFRVSATEAFWKTIFTKVSSSKILTQNFRFSNTNFGFSNRNFGFSNCFGFSYRNIGFLTKTSCLWKSKFRVFKPKLFVLQRFFFVLPKFQVLIPVFFATETSEYQIHTKFIVPKFRRNPRSFGRKKITMQVIMYRVSWFGQRACWCECLFIYGKFWNLF